MQTEPLNAAHSATTHKKRKRCPEADAMDIKTNDVSINGCEPPRKKVKICLQASDTKEEEESVHFLDDYVSNTVIIQRIKDNKRFHDEEEDDNDPVRKLKFTVLKPSNYAATHNDDNVLLLSPFWLRLSDVFSSAFKYNTKSKPTPNAAKKQFVDDLITFLKRNCIQDAIDTFYTLFRGRYYISERGFCVLLFIMKDFDAISHNVEHFCAYRFYYRREIFGTKLASFNAKKEQSIDDIMICNSCCLEDIEANFNIENPCDCECVLHKKCSEMMYDEAAEEEIETNDTNTNKKEWFCSYCVESNVSEEVLMKRRRDTKNGGNFEVEFVVDYDEIEDEYIVKWKNYPKEACCGSALSLSFIECVDEFWSKADRKITAKASKAIAVLKKSVEKETMKDTTIKEKDTKIKEKDTKKKSVEKETSKDKQIKEKEAKKVEQNEVKADKMEGKKEDKFIAVLLTDVMDAKYIIRRQKYTKETYEMMRNTTDKYRKWLLKEMKKESVIGLELKHEMARNQKKHLPKYHLRSVNREWDCDLPRIHDIIVNFLRRDWNKLEAGNVSHDAFVIGDIIDPENPAKKYGTDQGVHSAKAYGLFAIGAIKKDTLLFEYAGCVKPIGLASAHLDHLETELDQTTLFDLIGHLDSDRRKLFWGKKANDQLVIDPSKWHNEGVYMNDYRDRVMDDPDDDEISSVNQAVIETNNDRKQNVKFYEVLVNNWPRVFAVALCDIEAGEELLGDYGPDFWSNFRLMMRRQTQLAQIKKRIDDEWKIKYDKLKGKCEKQEIQIQEMMRNKGSEKQI